MNKKRFYVCTSSLGTVDVRIIEVNNYTVKVSYKFVPVLLLHQLSLDFFYLSQMTYNRCPEFSFQRLSFYLLGLW